ncbi:hypothetical protein [Vibrio renipiscarius]|uniref:hypothetical protein n=1 Tax=Vibrio renipiscarius TaxID=1461322 RepID=UPI000B2944BB|nr:hypothetical protein [Vibrio renipiscarius]
MSAVKKEYLSHQYRIIYFDGVKMAEFVVSAESREEAILALRREGFAPNDIFSINP